MADISVIIPTYNRSQCLKRSLDSVAAQRLRPFEVIVVDDGSTDDCEQVVTGYSTNSNLTIRYHYQQNRGPARARNRGIRMASGQYLAFLDSDDEWHRDKLSLQCDALKTNSQFLISHTKERWLRNNKHLNQKRYHIPRHGNIFKQSLRLCCVGMSTVMVRIELFDRYGLFDETLRCCEDYDLWLRISPFEEFYLVDKKLTIKHGGRPDQVSNQFRIGMDRFRIQALAKLIGLANLSIDQRQATCLEIVRRCNIYGKGCLNHGKETEAAYYFQLAEYFKS